MVENAWSEDMGQFLYHLDSLPPDNKKTWKITIKNKKTWKITIKKTMKENSINNWEGMTQKHTNNRTPKKPNNFGQNYGNQKCITKKLNG